MNIIKSINHEKREITLYQLDASTVQCIAMLQGIADKNNRKLELLFNESGEFSGEVWDKNCFYSKRDLELNGDFQPDYETYLLVKSQVNNYNLGKDLEAYYAK